MFKGREVLCRDITYLWGCTCSILKINDIFAGGLIILSSTVDIRRLNACTTPPVESGATYLPSFNAKWFTEINEVISNHTIDEFIDFAQWNHLYKMTMHNICSSHLTIAQNKWGSHFKNRMKESWFRKWIEYIVNDYFLEYMSSYFSDSAYYLANGDCSL